MKSTQSSYPEDSNCYGPVLLTTSHSSWKRLWLLFPPNSLSYIFISRMAILKKLLF